MVQEKLAVMNFHEDCAASKPRRAIYQKDLDLDPSTPMQEEAFHSRPIVISN